MVALDGRFTCLDDKDQDDPSVVYGVLQAVFSAGLSIALIGKKYDALLADQGYCSVAALQSVSSP